ncbi:hypothetical protein EVAR_78049_1 [Eumeta japonica]|uniref:Uncharacterized protein n=1 Tax=Eumeta variegata TaxID=151549 RepID=A0A4C1T3P4_EUMVA|nr:hypothetical protein EVAR_78049_1 [Eumeta japonica]
MEPCCGQLDHHKNEPPRPARYHALIEYRGEIGASAIGIRPVRQSRDDGIPCRSAAIDQVLKAPIYWGYGQRPTDRSVLLTDEEGPPVETVLAVELFYAETLVGPLGNNRTSDGGRNGPLELLDYLMSSELSLTG